MAVTFDTFLDLPPIPVDARSAARQALVVQQRIVDAGGVPAATAEAVQVILDTSAGDPPSELGRLRLLYQHAYTEPELEHLVLNTFADLGLAERPA